VKWKVSKGNKKFHPFLYGWEGVCLSVCVSVWIKKLKKRILMKFSGPVQLLTSNFLAGMYDQPASRVWFWAKNSLFLENLSPPWVFVLQWRDKPFGNLRTSVKKSRDGNFEFWGRSEIFGTWKGRYLPKN